MLKAKKSSTRCLLTVSDVDEPGTRSVTGSSGGIESVEVAEGAGEDGGEVVGVTRLYDCVLNDRETKVKEWGVVAEEETGTWINPELIEGK